MAKMEASNVWIFLSDTETHTKTGQGKNQMKPIKFDYANTTFARNQPEYLPLPAWTDGNQVVSGWSLTLHERLHILFSGVIWIRQMTFGHKLQPLRPQALSPFPKMPMVANDNIEHKTIGSDPTPPMKKLEPMDDP